MFRSAIVAALLFLMPAVAAAESIQKIVVAGGCFWCVESDFEQVDGVIEAVSGYAGGSADTATYSRILKGGTGHYEVVEITFDADTVSRDRLYDLFFRSIDPTDDGGQFCDRGASYRTAIFAQDSADRAAARAALAKAQLELGEAIVTEVHDLQAFYPAEKYHQDFYKKSPVRYKTYRKGCGRDKRVRQLWGSAAPFA